MAVSQAHVPTPAARRYLGQLCSHFAHRLPVTVDEATGRIGFEGGDCLLKAEADVLSLRIETADATQLERLEGVVARHLERFMFRETPEITWTRES